MTYHNDFTLPAEVMEQVAEQRLEILPELIRIVLNAAMQAERSEYLQAAPYQCTIYPSILMDFLCVLHKVIEGF